MNWFNKLPGFQQTPYGFEWRVLKMMPNLLLAGTLLPFLMALLARVLLTDGLVMDVERSIQTFDFVMIGLVSFIWAVVLTVAIFCVIVWVMKGPAYVADGYPVSDSDKPNKT